VHVLVIIVNCDNMHGEKLKKNSWYTFLLETEWTTGIKSMKNSNDTIGNRTRDLPARSAVPQPAVPARTPRYYVGRNLISINLFSKTFNYILAHKKLISCTKITECRNPGNCVCK